MPKQKTHADCRSDCCAGCGRGTKGRQKFQVVTAAMEKLLVKYAHPVYDRTVQSYPVGVCEYCRRQLFHCKKADENNEAFKPREEWASFHLEIVKVPRVSDSTAECPCPLCRCAKFNPIGVEGANEVVWRPVVNPSGGQMDCEIQPKAVEYGSKGPKCSEMFARKEEEEHICHGGKGS